MNNLFAISSAPQRAQGSRMRPLALVLAVSAIFSPLLQPAFAETASGGQVLITAARYQQTASDVLSDHVVIDAKEIAASGSQSLAELLQKKRGIEITKNGGAASTSSVFIRGTANTQSVVMVDGVRIGSSTLGGATWAGIPLSQIERIEIVYGPLSSLYGADAMGGVVQVFTKQGSTFLEPNLALGAGSHGVRQYELGLSGSTGGERALRYAVNLAHDEDKGFSSTKASHPFSYNEDADGFVRDSASLQLGWTVMKGHDVGASFLRSRQNTQFDTGPGYDDREVLTLESWSLYSKNQFAANWNSTLRLGHSEDRYRADASYGLSNFGTKQTEWSWQNDVSIGRDVLQVMLAQRKEEVASTEKALVRSRTTNSQALAYQFKLDQHLATFSVRHDSISGLQSVTTGAIGYGYRFTKALRVSGSYGSSFRAPTFNELYYPGYGLPINRPEKGKNLELGLVYDDGSNNLHISAYRNQITDLIGYAAVCPADPKLVDLSKYKYGCAYNINRAQLSGVSIGGGYKINQEWALRASLDWQNPKDELTGKRLPRRSAKHGSLTVDYSAGPWQVSLENVFSGQRYEDVGNKVALGGYGLLNVQASYAIAKNWRVQGRWNNVTSRDYELAKDYRSDRANLFVGVRYGAE